MSQILELVRERLAQPLGWYFVCAPNRNTTDDGAILRLTAQLDMIPTLARRERYSLICTMGGQESGKSTTANRIGGTFFPTGDGSARRTRGVDIAENTLDVGQEALVASLTADVEGNNGIERIVDDYITQAGVAQELAPTVAPQQEARLNVLAALVSSVIIFMLRPGHESDATVLQQIARVVQALRIVGSARLARSSSSAASAAMMPTRSPPRSVVWRASPTLWYAYWARPSLSVPVSSSAGPLFFCRMTSTLCFTRGT